MSHVGRIKLIMIGIVIGAIIILATIGDIIFHKIGGLF